jgi:hypothetical protein
MNTKHATLNRVPTEFEAETQFEPRPVSSAALRAARETEFERLKTRLLERELAATTTPELGGPVRQAANEAAALAWETLFPLLVFPVLFEEKTTLALRQAERQARLWAGRELAAA